MQKTQYNKPWKRGSVTPLVVKSDSGELQGAFRGTSRRSEGRLNPGCWYINSVSGACFIYVHLPFSLLDPRDPPSPPGAPLSYPR